MERYYPYDIFSTERIEETLTIEDGLIQLRHTPKYRSAVIEGFEETDSISLLLNQFRVDYSLDTYYRESNRLLHFNPARNGEEITISYITCGTVITAEDMNEIKAHLDSDHSKYYQLPTASLDIKGGVRVGRGLYMTGDILNVGSSIEGGSIEGGIFNYELPIASATQLGGVKIGNGLSISGNGVLSANATSNYTLPTATTSTKGGVIIGQGLSMTGDTLNADFTGLVLGEGLAFDENGKLCVVKEKNSDGWAYQDSGYDVIPAAPLIYVGNEWFYQPLDTAQKNDMFNTPEGVMEAWIRGDIYMKIITGSTSTYYPDRLFMVGAYSFSTEASQFFYNSTYGSSFAALKAYYETFINGQPQGSAITGLNLITTSKAVADCTSADINHFLLHMVSHPTDGYVEVALNYGTYRVEGNINDGKPFEKFFLYAASENVLFRNLTVSSTQLEY